MSVNKFVTHSNGKITRVDLNDGIVIHKQNDLPTTIELPKSNGQYVLHADDNGNCTFQEYQEQASIQLIPSQFMNANNTCAFTKGYPSLLIANSANDWTEMKLSTEYFQIIRCNHEGVYDTVNLNSTVFASVAGFNKQNCSTNTILYVDGADTKTDNKVKGISLTTAGPYFLSNNPSSSRIDALYVNPQNLFKNTFGISSNAKGLITYEGNTASKINLPTNAGYYGLMYSGEGAHSFSTLTLNRVVQSELTGSVDFKTQSIIPYMKQGSCRACVIPEVTATTNYLMSVNADKTIGLVPISTTNIGQVTFEKHSRYTSEKSIDGGTATISISELFPTFQPKTTGTYDITVHVVLYIEDTSVFDNITSENLACVSMVSGDYTDSYYIMNPQQNIINIKLTTPLAISDTPSLSFALGKDITGCKVISSYGSCLIRQYSTI